MAQSRNWKAYYSGDFTGYHLIIEGEVQAHKGLQVMPGLHESSIQAEQDVFYAQLENASDGDFKAVKEVFKVKSGYIASVVVMNKGMEEASIPVKPFGADKRAEDKDRPAAGNIHTSSWRASRILLVKGEVEAHKKASLHKVEPQGLNREVLLLEIVLEEVRGPLKKPQAMVYAEPIDGGVEYTSVDILYQSEIIASIDLRLLGIPEQEGKQIGALVDKGGDSGHPTGLEVAVFVM